jgi:hypothetical protein
VRRLNTNVAVAATLFVVFAGMVALTANYPHEARFVPLTVGMPALLLSGWQLWREFAGSRSSVETSRNSDEDRSNAGAGGVAIAWLAMFTLIVLAGGFVVGGTLAVMVSQRFWLRESWRTAGWGGVGTFAFLHFCFEQVLGVPLFGGWLATWIQR